METLSALFAEVKYAVSPPVLVSNNIYKETITVSLNAFFSFSMARLLDCSIKQIFQGWKIEIHTGI